MLRLRKSIDDNGHSEAKRIGEGARLETRGDGQVAVCGVCEGGGRMNCKIFAFIFFCVAVILSVIVQAWVHKSDDWIDCDDDRRTYISFPAYNLFMLGFPFFFLRRK
jgi:hypothetical protein